jgi:hypothetical protein
VNQLGRSPALNFPLGSAVVPRSSIRLTLMAGFLTALCTSLGIYTLSLVHDIPVANLTRDPLAVTRSSPVTGILSNLGVMAWAAATALCLLGAVILSRDRRGQQLTRFLLSSAMLSALLMFDDAFLIHDYFFPKYLGIRAVYVYAGYLFVIMGYLIYFARQIRATDYLLLIIAFSGFGISIALDKIFLTTIFETFVEDSFKFLGILFWLAYFARVVAFEVHTSTKSQYGFEELERMPGEG